MKPILITSYINPDLDGIAGSIAYNEFLEKTNKNSIISIFGEPHEEAKYILNRFGIKFPTVIQNANDFNEVILIDTSDTGSTKGLVNLEKVIEIIDHRKTHEVDKFLNAKIQIELVGSVATLVTEKFMKNNIDISKESAILLCGAIISNTLNFKGGVTTDRDREAFEYLNKVAQLKDDFWKELFEAKSDLSGNKLEERIKGDFKSLLIGGKKISIAQIEIIGARNLIKERNDEIVGILEELKEEFNLDLIFQTAVDLEEEKNFFVTNDVNTQKLLEKILDIKFDRFVAEKKGLMLRKQIVPLLKEELEK